MIINNKRERSVTENRITRSQCAFKFLVSLDVAVFLFIADGAVAACLNSQYVLQFATKNKKYCYTD